MYQAFMNLRFLKHIDFNNSVIQIVMVCTAAGFLWVTIKSLKIFWKLLVITLVCFALLFVFPATRQWILDFLGKIVLKIF